MKGASILNCALLLLAGACVCGGCIYNDEPMPEVVLGSPSRPLPPPRPSVSSPSAAVRRPPQAARPAVPVSWYPPSRLEKNWTAIVIHHSATDSGNAAVFDKWHREGNHWDGVGYDFVIGNGRGSYDGKVEVTYRWRQQKTGAHCGGTRANWANRDGIGICLVGDFSNTAPSRQQLDSLARLVSFLQLRYKIPKSRVYGHGDVPGARNTACPGRFFPMAAFKASLPF